MDTHRFTTYREGSEWVHLYLIISYHSSLYPSKLTSAYNIDGFHDCMQQCDVIGKHTHYYKSYMVATVGSASFPLQVTITPLKHSHEMGQVDSVESESKRGKERTGSNTMHAWLVSTYWSTAKYHTPGQTGIGSKQTKSCVFFSQNGWSSITVWMLCTMQFQSITEWSFLLDKKDVTVSSETGWFLQSIFECNTYL